MPPKRPPHGETPDLFGAPPSPAPRTSLRIVPPTAAPLSKEQKAFNNLLKKIETQRANLAAWEKGTEAIRQRVICELLPLENELAEVRWQAVQVLHTRHEGKGFTKPEKKKLARLITDQCGHILAHGDHEAAQALYDQYEPPGLAAEAPASDEVIREMLADMFGIELGEDADFSSPEAVMQQIEAQHMAQEAAQQANRKPSAREQAQAAKREAEEKQLSQSIREVFRKLASALHPDREPDPAERARKTDLMQRANQAYEAGNLLQLLELQLELEHIDQAHLQSLTPQRLAQYTKILKEQLKDLEAEITATRHQLEAIVGLSPFEYLRTPNWADLYLTQDIGQCHDDIAAIRALLDLSQNPAELKAWLKGFKPHRQRTASALDFL